MTEIGRGNIADYLSWRRGHRGTKKGGQVGARTLQKDRACLHAVFAFAEELELRDGNPVARVSPQKAEKRTPVILDAGQYAKLLNACEKRPMMLLYVTTLAEAGLRCDSEALHLRWEDVDLEEGYLWIASGRDGHRTKSGKGRWAPMTPKLRQAMREHFARFRLATYDAPGCSTTPRRGVGSRRASASASCGGPSGTRSSVPSSPRSCTSTISGTAG